MEIITETNLTKLNDKEYFDLVRNGKIKFSENIKYLDFTGLEINLKEIDTNDYIFEFYINDKNGEIEEIYLEKNIEKAKKFREKFAEAKNNKYNFELLNFKNEEILEILKIAFEKDQSMRKEEKLDSEKDFENLKIAVSILENNKNYLEESGDEKIFKALFYLIQHGPLKFQEKYINFFINISEKGKLEKSELPKMIDRILTNKGEKQKYATQYFKDKETGKYELYEVEDLENIDKIRKTMNLCSLEEENKKINK